MVRQAIGENKLWELAQSRCRGHPKLVGALEIGLKKHGRYLETVDPLTKKSALFYSGPETRLRPEVTRARRMMRERLGEGLSMHHPLYGKVPVAVALCYPIGQTEMPGRLVERIKGRDLNIDTIDLVKGVLDFQFAPGSGDVLGPFDIKRSKRTGRIRFLFRGDVQLGTFRARDFFFLPSIEGARILHGYVEHPGLRVVVDEEAAPFVAEGRSAFAKFVEDSDPSIVPGQEVLLVDGEDRLLATGTARMNQREMSSFNVGVAVDVRHGVGKLA
jgi:7-cyano-7-deazaguanine tRNA-ribosyltransferase